jgi:DNA helicase HerA-like ATPase
MSERTKGYPQDEHGVSQLTLGPDSEFLLRLDAEIEDAGGEFVDPRLVGAIGVTMFDLPNSEDGSVTVVLPKENIAQAPSQALVRITDREDGRSYLGVVSAGPFAEPDSLRGDSPMLITATARGGVYLPPYHGRLQVAVLGEEIDGRGAVTLTPPRFRPRPNSPVRVLADAEAQAVLRCGGDIDLGLMVGYEGVEVGVPSDDKSVLPRHTAILGTTGGGKSTTVARLVVEAQAAGMAVVLLDVEGEYTHLHEPTEDQRMLAGLAQRGLEPRGVPADRMTLYHLVGRETANPEHPNRHEFSLRFDRLSPYTIIEILGLNEAQTDRFLFAYDMAKVVMRKLGLFPQAHRSHEEQAGQERMLLDLDEFSTGYPMLTLAFLADIVSACLERVDTAHAWEPRHPSLESDAGAAAVNEALHSGEKGKFSGPGNAASWGKLLSLLRRLQRLHVFDRTDGDVRPVRYSDLVRAGTVSVVDLSDSTMSELSNIVIADLLRGVQLAQDRAYAEHEKALARGEDSTAPAPVLVIIEEAHEFLSAERIEKLETLFKQVATIAKRGRKRRLGLVFVTQLPQHLPRQVFGLVNSYILHKITDPQVVSTLQRTVSGIDEGLWKKLPGLAPGQAIVSFPHMAQPLLVSVHPAPAKLRLAD